MARRVVTSIDFWRDAPWQMDAAAKGHADAVVMPVAPGNYHIDDASQDRIADRVRTALGCEP
jgi:hypothetical protein